jgi:hypothetical protein
MTMKSAPGKDTTSIDAPVRSDIANADSPPAPTNENRITMEASRIPQPPMETGSTLIRMAALKRLRYGAAPILRPNAVP